MKKKQNNEILLLLNSLSDSDCKWNIILFNARKLWDMAKIVASAELSSCEKKIQELIFIYKIKIAEAPLLLKIHYLAIKQTI